jgi:sugar phosphate permease
MAVLMVAFLLPFLLIIHNIYLMGITLFAFGCGIGTIDVAMNSQGVQVQNAYGKSIMSSLHGLFSVGGLFGSIGLGFLIKFGLNPIYAAITISALLLLLLAFQYKNLLNYQAEKEIIQKFSHVDEAEAVTKRFQWLNGTVLVLGFMCFIVFLSEGAMLDWSAIFLRDHKGSGRNFQVLAMRHFLWLWLS